jgi:hypothetical protein
MLKLLCSAAAAFLGSAPSAAASRALAGASFLGFNVVNLQSGNFTTDEAYAAATAGALQAGVLRYPGGNIADFWDWRVGWCVAAPNASGCPSCRNPCPSKLRRRTYLLEEFAVALRAAAALPVFTLNMLTANLTESLAMLAHAESIGALPRGAYVELGGEFYWGKFEGRWATGAAGPYGYGSFEEARRRFVAEHVPPAGPAIYVTSGVRVEIADVVGSGWTWLVYFGGGGHGMSHVRRVQGWGFNSLVTLEAAADVMTFDQLRYTPNSGPYCLGARPASCDREPPSNSTTRCRGNFTAVPAIVALRPTNALLWMGRADG